MKKSFKIILAISLLINLTFIALQVSSYYTRRSNLISNIERKYSHLTKVVNIAETKKNFMDSLFHKYPQLKIKKYLYINIWDTGDQYSIKQLPTLDTLIKPLLPEVGYVLVNDEKPDYSNYVLKRDIGKTTNFVFINRAEDFIQAINQELRIPRRRFNYPVTSMNLILDNTGKIVYFDTLQTYSGPKWPEDSLKDKIYVQQLNKAFSELK